MNTKISFSTSNNIHNNPTIVSIIDNLNLSDDKYYCDYTLIMNVPQDINNIYSTYDLYFKDQNNKTLNGFSYGNTLFPGEYKFQNTFKLPNQIKDIKLYINDIFHIKDYYLIHKKYDLYIHIYKK